MNYVKQENSIREEDSGLVNHLPDIGMKKIQEEIFTGLRSEQKYISSKFFYDKKGSELFESITGLDEYYPTRTEKKILSTIGQELKLDFSELSIVELGSGDPSKIRLLLQQIPKSKLYTLQYFPVDISQSAIEDASKKLICEFPTININGIVADFILQPNRVPKPGRRLFCFFGSTIGNLTMDEIEKFMKRLGAEMQEGDSLLLGLDMVKDTSILEKAYNDEQQITADFNKNILNVINVLADTDFDPDAFEHRSFYNKEEERIEMHLEAKRDAIVTLGSEAGKIYIKKGETIHTENSHKFRKDHIETIGLWGGLSIEKIFTDNYQWFSLVHYRAKPAPDG